MRIPRRPTFIVIGAMKCGTTSLYYYLADHPDISMSAVKETDYFVAEKNYARGLGWYQSLFKENAIARGECSPNYTKTHLFAGVPARIRDVVPCVKLIYLVRDPVKRTVSHYLSAYAQGREKRSLDEALRDLAHSNYVLTSRYYEQLRPYFELFGRDQVLVITTEQLQSEVYRTLQTVYKFLGVDEGYRCQWAGTAFNTTVTKKVRPDWYQWVSSQLLSQRFKDWIRPYVPTRWLPGQALTRPVLSADLRAELKAHFRPDVSALRATTEQSFEAWDV